MSAFLRKILLISLVGCYVPASQAELTLEITKGIESAIPIAVVPFGWTGSKDRAPEDLAPIIQADLSRSGLLKTLPVGEMLTMPSKANHVRFRNWQALGQEYLVIGEISEVVDKQYQVQFQLFNVYRGEQFLGYRLTVSEKELRRTAHHISDLIYEKLTNKKGVFGTRLAYITTTSKANKKLYKLIIADADGFEPRVIASSLEPIMSPTWSPDGKQIAYVSFENKRSAIFVQTLANGKRERVASYKGINGAPSFSPDGTRLALTLSKDGSTDIYILNLNNRSLTKITKSYGIDTEPSWSPDGKTIVYTSDRGGKPQLYTVPSNGGKAKRLTFEGDYNARGQFSLDGKNIAMVHANRGDYRIAVMDMATRTVNVLTAGRYDEAPSFSPNGEMVLYASRKGNKNVLSAVSIDGRMQQNLSFDNGDVREPAWSP
ncbi:MAG: Tol-Pal system beta propeller repeat protein TolB [Methylococcales bacterium]|nr:Tol-Pal system beta propeller repeat protein TolB [Methylococcales bacterium]